MKPKTMLAFPLAAALVLMISTGAYAVWASTSVSNFDVSVGSEGVASISYTIPFANKNIDTTSGQATSSQLATIYNGYENGKDAKLNLSVEIIDPNDGCVWNNDCTWEWHVGNSEAGATLHNGDTIHIGGLAYYEIYWKATCLKNSCPATLKFNTSITELP